MERDIELIEIDLFCGAGGVTTGSEEAEVEDKKVCEVIACVNHDENAIASHKANHPKAYHFIEDVRMVNLNLLKDIVKEKRLSHPNAKLVVWCSAECTNYSDAKGGAPKDADSRTLPQALYMKYNEMEERYEVGDSYIQVLNPDIIWVENVEEFMSWGPLDGRGRPVSRKKGIDYLKWVENIKALGYDYDFRILTCADYGDYTFRERYFGQFVKKGLPISWPIPTHSKFAKSDMFGSFKKWKAVREVLDLQDEGNSIFDRKKPLVEATLDRFYSGLIKFVAGGKDKFISKYYSGNPNQMVSDIDSSISTIRTKDCQSLISTAFLSAYYSGSNVVRSVEGPSPTITRKDRLSVVRPKYFIDQQYGCSSAADINKPLGSLTKNPKFSLITCRPWLMDTNYRNVGTSLDSPSPVITANRKWHYLINPQFKSGGSSIDYPCFTLIARMDKRPPYIVEVTRERKSIPSFIRIIGGQVIYEIYDDDTPNMKKIKEFMAAYGLIDIKMRMLKVVELLRITGFPEDYILVGSKEDQKKFIGNAVPVKTVRALIESTARGVMQMRLTKVA
jgi:DNA (cytosine-5)-methyltransferase 1